MSLLWQRDETKRLYSEELEVIKPHLRYAPSNYNFESLEDYIDVFDVIPTEEKKRVIEYFVMTVWHYKDRKKRGMKKKSIAKFRQAIETYQEAIRELHKADVVDEVIFRNGNVYDYEGEDDYDEDFDINLHLWNLPNKLKENYLTNIEILKELDIMEPFVKEVMSLTQKKHLPLEIWDKIDGEFRLIRPSDFYGVHRPSKDNIKKVLYAYAEQYNIPAYKMKSLIDAI